MKLYTTYWRKMRFNDRFEERPEFEGVLKVKISQGASQYDPGSIFSNVVDLGEEPFAPPEYLLKAYQESEKTLEDDARFERVYRERLGAVGIDEVRRRLEEAVGGVDVAFLVCHETSRIYSKKKGRKFCHRHVLAAWWEEQTGEVIDEV